MERLQGVELGGLYRRRPETGERIHNLGEPLEVWLLNDIDSIEQTKVLGKGAFLLQARIRRTDGSEGQYLIISKIGKAISWELHQDNPVGEGYRLVRKGNVGRPKRELSGQEREAVHQLREQGMSVNAIATRLHVGNRLIMQELKCE